MSRLIRGVTAMLVATAVSLAFVPEPGLAAKSKSESSARDTRSKAAKARSAKANADHKRAERKNVAVAPPPVVTEPIRLLVPPLIKPAQPRPRQASQGASDGSGASGSRELINLPAGKVDDTVSLGQRIILPRGHEKVSSLKVRGLPVQEVLGVIAESYGLNMVIDPSVGGIVAVDFDNVPLNQVVETLLSTNALTMLKMGTAYVIYRSGRYGQALIKFVPVHFTNASDLVSKIVTITGATGLSGASNAGAGGGGTGGGGQSSFSPTFKLIADARTNSLIVHGSGEDIDIVEKLTRRLDVLMPSKIFRLTHLTPTEAIALLRNSYFVGAGRGSNTAVQGGGAAAGGAAVVRRVPERQPVARQAEAAARFQSESSTSLRATRCRAFRSTSRKPRHGSYPWCGTTTCW